MLFKSSLAVVAALFAVMPANAVKLPEDTGFQLNADIAVPLSVNLGQAEFKSRPCPHQKKQAETEDATEPEVVDEAEQPEVEVEQPEVEPTPVEDETTLLDEVEDVVDEFAE